MDINILAFESFGNEIGRDYFAKELKGDDQIVILFDLCQILQAYITPEGWRHLFSHFGIKKLYGIDKISGWLNTDDPEDWIHHCTMSLLFLVITLLLMLKVSGIRNRGCLILQNGLLG